MQRASQYNDLKSQEDVICDLTTSKFQPIANYKDSLDHNKETRETSRMSNIAKAYLQGAPKNITKKFSETQRHSVVLPSYKSSQIPAVRGGHHDTQIGLKRFKQSLPQHEQTSFQALKSQSSIDRMVKFNKSSRNNLPRSIQPNFFNEPLPTEIVMRPVKVQSQSIFTPPASIHKHQEVVLKQQKLIPKQEPKEIKKSKEIIQNKEETLDKAGSTLVNFQVKRNRNFILQNITKYKGQDRQRFARLQRLQRAKQLLQGKVSVIWIFIISGQIDPDLKDRIFQVYKGLMDDSKIVPFVQNAWQIQPFLQLPNVYFKIVTNIRNCQEALRYKINVKVVEYYIFNDQGDKGMSEALQYKSWSKKVKGIYTDLENIIQKTQQEIEDTIQIYRYNNNMQTQIKQTKFPSFMKLTGKDKTQATLYRANLYGSIRLSQQDKAINMQYFMLLVREKYAKIQKQQKNIQDYLKIKHLALIKNLDQARQIIQFYVRESFYYMLVNSMLRTLKTTQEFKPCILPFNETYHSVKLFYQSYLQQHQRKIPAMTLYRGAKLKKRDYNSLSPGDYIQMFGFMSTSKTLKNAQKFTDKDGYIFVINVKQRVVPQKYDLYDHGFVDINKYKLAAGQFDSQQEVLFNALNVYKVVKIEQGDYNMIYLQYGAIFDLLGKPKPELTPSERDVLINYQYCTKLLGDIEDQGDVHLLSYEYDQAKQYYEDKISKNNKDAKNYLKLANVQKQCGEIDQAQKNGQICLQLYTQKMDMDDRERCLKVFSIHSKNAQINIAKQDYLNAQQELTKGIQYLDDSDLFTKAKKIRERGQLRFKKGQVKDSQIDFIRSQKMFNEINSHSEERKWQVQKNYWWSLLTLCCRPQTKSQLSQRRDKQLQEITDLQSQIQNLREIIDEELIKVNKSLKDVAIYAQDKERYEYCVKKGRAYLMSIQQRQTNDPILKAKLKVMQATIQDYLALAESEILLSQAIAMVESKDPFDPAVAQYSTILAKLQKKQLQKFLNPQSGLKLQPGKKLQYNQKQQKGVYSRCKSNFQKALKVLLYNNKTKDCPQVVNLKNQLGELQFNQNNFKSCEQIINEVKTSASGMQHTQISKASLLLGKIAFSRGQLKNSFQIIQQADNMLKKVLIKSKQNPVYIKIYQKNDIYLQIVYIRAKVYHKQLFHDLSLQQLSLLSEKLQQKMDGYDSHQLTASLYQQQAQVWASLGDSKFVDSFQKALQLRRSQMGNLNIFNAVTYCNFSKYLMVAQDMQHAQQNLAQAVQIFSCLSNDHPINWVIYFSNGTFNELKEQYPQADKLFKNSLKMAQKKYDPSHITIKKVRLKMAKVLLKLGDIDQSFKTLQQLQQENQQDLRQSIRKTNVQVQIDDQKITLEKLILTQLKTVIETQQNKLNLTQAEVAKYRQKYQSLTKTYHIKQPQT